MEEMEEVQQAPVPMENGINRANRKRVYVGNLSYSSSWQDLKDHMRKAGEVVFADVFMTEGGYSKGCGVVEFSTEAEAQMAISTLGDTILDGTERPIFVREDRIDSEYPRGRGRGMYRGMPRGRGAYMMQGGGMMGHQNMGHMMLPMQGVPYGRGAPMYGRGHMMPYGRGRGSTGPVVEGSRVNRQVFVGNLPYTVSWQELKDVFGEIGTIIRADILIGPDGRSKGMGTVCFETEESAQKAIETLNDSELEGRTIHVSKDKFAK